MNWHQWWDVIRSVVAGVLNVPSLPFQLCWWQYINDFQAFRVWINIKNFIFTIIIYITMYIIVVAFKINIIQPFSRTQTKTLVFLPSLFGDWTNVPAAFFLCFNRGHVPHRGIPTLSLDEDDSLVELSSRMECENRNFIVDYQSYYSLVIIYNLKVGCISQFLLIFN